MKILLLVDGSNIVMRAAFGGQIEPEQSVRTATGLIERAIRQCQATHMVIAMDSDEVSWRKELLPTYKGNRTLDTTPWIQHAFDMWTQKRWRVEEWAGFEADDIIATLAERAMPSCSVVVLSNDSDLLPLSAAGARILKPVNGGVFMFLSESDICKKYEVNSSLQLVDLKAMVGEKTDNIPGVPGIGEVRAASLLRTYKNLGMVILAGNQKETCKYSKQVAECADAANLAFQLVSLRKDVPIPPIDPNTCALCR